MVDQAEDGGEILASAVEAVLRDLVNPRSAAHREDRLTFAFNTLVNALGGLLETIRQELPDQHRTYYQMAILMLDGTPSADFQRQPHMMDGSPVGFYPSEIRAPATEPEASFTRSSGPDEVTSAQ